VKACRDLATLIATVPDELLSAELSAGQMIAVSVHSISTIVLKYQFSAA
jgi:hypothetical protein